MKIIDNGQAKGKISCTDDSSSCIRNLGNLNIEGVTAEGPFVVVKNDVEGDMYGDLNILNSTLTSSYTKSNTGTIMNWGKAEITNSKVNASASGIAIYATSGAKPGKNSEITLNNNILDGKYSIYEKRYAATDKTTQTIKVNGGTLTGIITTNVGSVEEYSGNIILNANHKGANNSVIANSKPGTKVTLDMDYNSVLSIPEGVTVVIPENRTLTVTLNGGTYPIEDIENVVIPEGKEIVENADGTYSIVDVKNEEETPEVTVDTDKNDQNVKDENAVNPKTSDMIMTVVLIAIIALAGMAIAVIKLRKKNA